MRRALIVVLICLVAGPPALAQSTRAADLLRAITVEVHVENASRGQQGLCQGFVAGVSDAAAYVVTAKHCIDDLASTRISAARSMDQLGVAIQVAYANGTSGDVERLAGADTSDVVVLLVSYTDAPTAFADCAECQVYRSFGRDQRIPVLSMLSAGGGPPVVSSGVVVSDRSGEYTVVLPTSPGTSGSAVTDLQGNLVGMVVSLATVRGADAGFTAGIVSGGPIEDLLRYAISRFAGAAAPAPSAAQAAPPTPPTLAPGAARTWSGDWTSQQGAQRGAFTASLSQRGPTVLGTATLTGTACYPTLQLLGSSGGNTGSGSTYSLTGYSDGLARISFSLTVTGNTVSGTYVALQSGTPCDGDRGSVSGTVQ
ncbi:MAG TPA: trypsin-like peptidase domain-containing protein [bacterium]|nr:trypsin-like peptidase domain-containing protein [bacterium]